MEVLDGSPDGSLPVVLVPRLWTGAAPGPRRRSDARAQPVGAGY
jgi:hypothetical protein